MSTKAPWYRRLPVWAVAMIAVVGLVSSTALGMGAYADIQSQSQAALQQSVDDLQARIAEVQPQRDALALAVTNGKQLLADSSGKTLDDAARSALNNAIAQAESALKQVDEQIAQAQQQLVALATQPASALQLPWETTALAQKISSVPTPEATSVALVVSGVGAQVKAVQSAQSAWQAEQERLAAEAAAATRAAAARAAAAAAAAAARTLAESGGTTSTTPAPPASVQAAAPVQSGFSAENYIAALAPNTYVVWTAGACAAKFGAGTYLCGWVSIAQGTARNARLPVTLDSDLADRYSNSVGVTVLVHEAAHARQFYKYGWNMVAPNTTAPSNLTGTQPAEFMADCATIAKLGRSTGSYVGPYGSLARSCSAAQIAEAAQLWVG
jgi:chemotaxis protein histidine kinase CheA